MKNNSSKPILVTIMTVLVMSVISSTARAQNDFGFLMSYYDGLDTDRNGFVDLGDANLIAKHIDSLKTPLSPGLEQFNFCNDEFLNWLDLRSLVEQIPIVDPATTAGQELELLKSLASLLQTVGEPIPVPYGMEAYDHDGDGLLSSDDVLTVYVEIVSSATIGFCVLGDIAGPDNGPPDGVVDSNDHDKMLDSQKNGLTEVSDGNLDGFGLINGLDFRIFFENFIGS